MRYFYLVINSEERGDQIFNSKLGAEGWIEDWGGELVPVREVNLEEEKEKDERKT